MKMCSFHLDQNVIGNAVQCSKCLRNCSLFFVIHKQQIQLAHSEPDWGRKWEFYDLFELCGPFTAKQGIGFRLKMTSQWLEKKLSTFSALDSSQISYPSGPTTNIYEMEKEQWIAVLWVTERGATPNSFSLLSLEYWNPLTERVPSHQNPKRDWTN